MAAFLKPTALQSSSPLMICPAEIRLEVLRMLLKSQQALLTEERHDACKICDRASASKTAAESASDTDDEDEPKSKAPPGCTSEGFYDQRCFNLSSQILRCCQQLHDEARPMLCYENMLSVFFDNGDCYTLDAMTEVPDSFDWWRFGCKIPDLAESSQDQSLRRKFAS